MGFGMRRSSKQQAAHKFKRGVTLVELMVVIAIVAIMAAVAVPAMSQFINDLRVSNATNEFVNALNEARSEAIKSGRLVTVCRSTDAGTAATPSCSNGGDWSVGWLVFIESSSTTNVRTFEAGEVILARHGALSTNIAASLTGLGNVITFNSTGEPSGVGSFGINFNYNGHCARQITMSRAGRVKVTPDAIPPTQCN